jgi:hypothetical protein
VCGRPPHPLGWRVPLTCIGFGVSNNFFPFSLSPISDFMPAPSKNHTSPTLYFSFILVLVLLSTFFLILNKTWNYKYFLISLPFNFYFLDLVFIFFITIFFIFNKLQNYNYFLISPHFIFFSFQIRSLFFLLLYILFGIIF